MTIDSQGDEILLGGAPPQVTCPPPGSEGWDQFLGQQADADFLPGKMLCRSLSNPGFDTKWVEASLVTAGAEDAPVWCVWCPDILSTPGVLGSVILSAEVWFLLTSPQLSSLSLPGGPAVL